MLPCKKDQQLPELAGVQGTIRADPLQDLLHRSGPVEEAEPGLQPPGEAEDPASGIDVERLFAGGEFA